MTKEQETIERLNRFKTIKVLYGNTFAMHIEQLKVLQEDIETILNMLKKMKTQEENYKNLIADVSRIAKELGLEEDGTIDEIYAKIKEKDKEIEHLKENINYQTLCDFLISSVSADEEPMWTEKHIEELLENFEVRWKNAYK